MTINQTFTSQSNSEYSETQYLLPLSDEICIESFTASYQDKTIKGLIKSKQDAAKEYIENKQQGNLVSYAELETKQNDDYVKIKLGNLPPNEKVHITLTYSQQLQTYLNKYYILNIPLQQAIDNEIDAKLGQKLLELNISCTGRINYAEPSNKKLSLVKNVLDEFNTQFLLDRINNSEHHHLKLLYSYEGMSEPQVIFGDSQVFTEDSVKQAILPTKHSAMITFLPDFNKRITHELDDAFKASQMNGEDIVTDTFHEKVNEELIDHLKSSKSEYIFLLDSSGSMRGKPFEKAIDAIKLFLQSLPSDSYFNIISFGSDHKSLYKESQRYTSQTMNFAIERLKTYSANMGGTNIFSPLSTLFTQKRMKGYNKQIFVLTDGAVDNRESVISIIKKNNKTNRVHFIGFGSGADKVLIEESSIAGKGIHQFVELNQDLSGIIINMLCQTISPTLDKIQIGYDKEVFESVYPNPEKMPCVFKDEPFSLHLFFKPLIKLDELSDAQKIVTISYFDSSLKQDVSRTIQLESKDQFTYNQELRQTIFKVGKQQQINEKLLQKEQNALEYEAIDHQLLTKQTAMICVIQKINDEQRAVYETIPQKVYAQMQNYQEVFNENCAYLYSNVQAYSSSASTRGNVMMRKSSALDSCSSIMKQSVQIPQASMQKSIPLSTQVLNQSKKEMLSKPKSSVSLRAKAPSSSSLISTNSGSTSSTTTSIPLTVNKPTIKASKPLAHRSETISYEESKSSKNEEIQEINEAELKFMKLEKLVSLVDSEGNWKFDEKLIKLFASNQYQSLVSLCSSINNKDIFMTLFLICILEKFYASLKQKWVLISKKSVSSVKDTLPSEQFSELKSQIANLLC